MGLFRFLVQPSDYESAVHFFHETMELPIVFSWDDDGLGTILQAPGAQIELFGTRAGAVSDPAERPHRPAPSPGRVDVGLLWEVSDLESLALRLTERAATIVSPPTDRPWGMRCMTIEGPDGILVTVAQAAEHE